MRLILDYHLELVYVSERKGDAVVKKNKKEL